MTPNLPHTSSTSIEADLRCGQERFWLTEYLGAGMKPNTVDEDLEVGRRVHLALEAFFKGGGDLAAALHALHSTDLLNEPWQTWLEASIIAWATRVWPNLAKRYRILSVEEFYSFEHEGVTFKCKPDLVLEDLTDGTVWIYDFKSYTWWDNKKWTRSLQLQIGCIAVERTLGRPVAGTIIQGIYKGQLRKDTLYHDLVFGYRREGEPGITKTAYSWGYKRGFERFDVTQYPGGVAAWVAASPDSIITDAVPQTAPIFLNRPMMDRFLHQRALRELDIFSVRGVRADAPSMVFPLNPTQCESGRHRCPYFEACWIDTVSRDPVGSGIYHLRTPKEDIPNAT